MFTLFRLGFYIKCQKVCTNKVSVLILWKKLLSQEQDLLADQDLLAVKKVHTPDLILKCRIVFQGSLEVRSRILAKLLLISEEIDISLFQKTNLIKCEILNCKKQILIGFDNEKECR